MAKTWKGLEKDIAKCFNTKRNAFSGSNSGLSASDSQHDQLYIECKNHANQAILTLMTATEQKAKQENKTPIIVLGDPEDRLQNMYVMFNIKDLFNIMKEIDLNELHKSIPDGTTIAKLLERQATGSDALIRVKEDIEQRISALFRNKILSKEHKDMLKTLSLLSFCVDNIKSYAEGINE